MWSLQSVTKGPLDFCALSTAYQGLTFGVLTLVRDHNPCPCLRVVVTCDFYRCSFSGL